MDFLNHLEKYLETNFIKNISDSLNEKRTNSLILNLDKFKINEFKNEFSNIEQHPFINNLFYYKKEDYEFGKSYLFDNGAYYIIDASSALVSYFLDINDDDLILDLCAAPGGKTISSSFKNKNALFISNDISYERSLILSSNIEKMGLSNVIVTNNDFSKIYKNYHETFSKIILDAPCSGSAMFRKNDLALKDWSIEKVKSLAIKQLELLEIASFMLKEGGIISYSTCSFSFEENEGVILDFLKKHNEFSLITIKENSSFFHSKELKEAIHLFPNLYKGEGQFICILKKDGTLINSLNKKKKFKNSDYDNKYNLNFLNKMIINNEIYEYNHEINLKPLKIIRAGLHVGSINKNNFIPDFHLAHYLNSINSIKLNEEEFKKYIKGETFNILNYQNGFYVVSFKNINLGFIKIVNNVAKNHYPKGLRH